MSTNPFLSALASMQALNTKPATTKAERTTTKQELTPTGMSLRVFKSGAVYPSQELVNHFNLEYTPATDEQTIANGLDVFLAWDLPNFDKENFPNAILVAPVAKSEPKVDLFKSTDYNEDGTPKASVLTQGSTTFGKRSFISMLETVLNQESSTIFSEQKFIDIQVETEYQLPIAGDFLYLPKVQVKGDKAGEVVLFRRHATKVYPTTVIWEADQQPLTEQGADNQPEEQVVEATDNYIPQAEPVSTPGF